MHTRARVALFIAATLIFSCVPALAASQLSGLVVVPARGGAVRVALSFAGAVPTGWTVVGAGTQTPAIVLPATSTAPSVNQPAYAGSGDVSSVSLSQSGGTLTVTLHLNSAMAISTHVFRGVLFVDVAGARAAATPTPPPGESTPMGNIGNGQNYEIVPLKYADVSEVVGLLVQGQQVTPNDVFTPTGSIFSLPTSTNGIPSTGSNYGSSFGNPMQQPSSFGERVNDSIGYDRRLNAIVLYGSPDQIAQYKAFIKAVDVPVPSVMLSCEVVELNETSARDLGIDFTNGPNGPIGTASAALGPLTNSGFGAVAPNLTANLQASLYATIAHGGGKILATPRVLALNGSPAQILSGDALPIISTTIISGSSPITQTNVNYIAVGINMQIQPRIDPNGFVTSHIFAEVSSVTQYIETTQGQVPQISLRQVSTEATVKNGQPFVVGGLLKDEEIENMSKIPILGDLPIIGGLFRVRHTSTQRTNLYIFITPQIIHTTGVPNPGSLERSKLPQPDVPGPLPYATPSSSP
jgi:general secretion pathway protein D